MKYVLVTGASGGMGSKTIAQLLDIGYGVIAMDNKDCLAVPNNVQYIQADITDERSVLHAFEKVKNITDSIYAIVHFAGIYMLDSLVEISTAYFERIMKCNLFGAYLINKIFLPLIQKGGKIIVTTSELAPLNPLPFGIIWGH